MYPSGKYAVEMGYFGSMREEYFEVQVVSPKSSVSMVRSTQYFYNCFFSDFLTKNSSPVHFLNCSSPSGRGMLWSGLCSQKAIQS